MTDRVYPSQRVDQYVAALRNADTYAQFTDRRDLDRFARAVMAVADTETDPVYRSGYTTGRQHAGAGGWALATFTPVFTTSDGTDCPATELRCSQCNGLVQGVGPHTLIDLMALASQHECPTASKDDR